MFGSVELPQAFVVVKQIEDIPEAKVGFIYRFDSVGYYVGQTCKVFMPHRVRALLQQGKVEEYYGENTYFDNSNVGNRIQADRAVA